MGEKITMWDRDRLAVWVEQREDGRLVISGQDLRRGEYEYFLDVAADDVPLVADALGCGPDGVLAALVDQAESIIRQGEKTWLCSIGVTPAFFSPS